MNKKICITTFIFVAICVVFLLTIPSISLADNEDKSGNVARVDGTEYATLADAVDAATEGQTVEIIQAFDPDNKSAFLLPGSHSTEITITKDNSLQTEEAAIYCDFEGNICWFQTTTTFSDVKIIFSTETTYSYHGFWESPNIIFNNCILQGLFLGYGDCTFNNCNFVQTKSEYNMWTYSGNHTYTNCTFESNGKFINVYNSGMGITFTHKFDGCKFINNGDANKSAINVKANCIDGAGLITKLMWDIQINNCSLEGNFPVNNRLKDKLVMIDDYNSEFITITKDGKQLYPELPKEINIGIDEEIEISTALSDGQQPVTWTSTNDKIIKILNNTNAESSIKVKRISAGSACIIASVNNMISYYYFGAPMVEFNMCGHGTQIAAQVLNPEDNPEMRAVRPEDPTAEGYEFDDWYADQSCTIKFNFETQIIGDTVIYAKWTGSGPTPPDPPYPPDPPQPPEPDPGYTPINFQQDCVSANTSDTTSFIAIAIPLLILTWVITFFVYLLKKARKHNHS